MKDGAAKFGARIDVDDLHKILKKHGQWMELGCADEQKPAKAGTVVFLGRDAKNPVKRPTLRRGRMGRKMGSIYIWSARRTNNYFDMDATYTQCRQSNR